MTAGALAPARSRPLLGVVLMLFAVLSFTLLDSSAKYLSDDYALPQLLWARYTFSLLLVLAATPWLGVRQVVRTERLPFQLARGGLLLLATASIFTAVRFLPIADAYAISFVSPVIVAALAIPLLGERVSTARWVAIVAGFLGVIVVMRPGSAAFSWAVVFPLAMATFYALYQIMTRMLGPRDRAVTTLFYTMLTGAIVTSILAPVWWRWPTLEGWAVMFGMGVIGLIGQLALIRAFSLAEASYLSPFVYTQILWATLIGYLVFGDLPDATTLGGSAIIIASGIVLMKQRATQPPPAARR